MTAGRLVGWTERMGIHGRPETRIRRTRTTSPPTIPILASDSSRFSRERFELVQAENGGFGGYGC